MMIGFIFWLLMILWFVFAWLGGGLRHRHHGDRTSTTFSCSFCSFCWGGTPSDL